MKITVNEETLRRIKGFTHLADGEVGGMARCTISEGKAYVWDLLLFKGQVVTGGSVNLDDELLIKFLTDKEKPEEFKFLWHSHANLGAFHSSTDDECITSMLKTSPYIISYVTTKNENDECKLFFTWEGMRFNIKADVEQMSTSYNDLKEELDEHVEEKIIQPFGHLGGKWNKDDKEEDYVSILDWKKDMKNKDLSDKDMRFIEDLDTSEYDFDTDGFKYRKY